MVQISYYYTLQKGSRKQRKIQNGKKFKISFAGAAVIGRGNYFERSFPSVLAEKLIEPFKKLGIELEVRNAAIAGIGSFPFGWCFKNALGHTISDLILGTSDNVYHDEYMHVP
jgi:hypothetical protein